MPDAPDYTEAATPLPHHESHEDEGDDEISLAGLSGESAELAAHSLLPTVHQDAPDLILTHKGDASAHHAKYTDTDAQAVADIQIAEHALLPTVHQDAPDLILTHKGDASAHHTAFTAALARAAINDIFGADGKADADIDLDGHDLKGGSVILPNLGIIGIGAAVERLTFFSAGYAAFHGCKLGIEIAAPSGYLHVAKLRTEAAIFGVNATDSLVIWPDNTVGYGPALMWPSALSLRFGTITGYGAAGWIEKLRLTNTGDLDINLHNASSIGLKLGGTLVTASAAEINFLNDVSYGIDDSGGAGYKVLRVPN